MRKSMKKRMFALLATAALTIGTMGMSVSAKNADDFSDVKPGYWYYDVVKDVAEKELMTGMNDSYFGATELLARSHVACVLYRMDGSPQTGYQWLYPDVAEGQFYSEAVTWANQTGVITGYSNGTFGPADQITREQLVTIMYRYAKAEGRENVSEKVSLDGYADGGNVSAFATEAMQWAVATGVIKGEGNSGLLNPQGNVSRAVCAAIISRFAGEGTGQQCQHNWVYHEEQGHEETYTVKEEVYEPWECCNVCGADCTADPSGHMKAHALAGEGGGRHTEYYKTKEVTKTRWVVDVQAYTDCSKCGARQ